MKKILTVILFSVLLAGCSTPKPNVDKYPFPRTLDPVTEEPVVHVD